MVICNVILLCTKYEAGVSLLIPPPLMIIVGIRWHVISAATEPQPRCPFHERLV